MLIGMNEKFRQVWVAAHPKHQDDPGPPFPGQDGYSIQRFKPPFKCERKYCGTSLDRMLPLSSKSPGQDDFLIEYVRDRRSLLKCTGCKLAYFCNETCAKLAWNGERTDEADSNDSDPTGFQKSVRGVDLVGSFERLDTSRFVPAYDKHRYVCRLWRKARETEDEERRRHEGAAEDEVVDDIEGRALDEKADTDRADM